MPGRRCIVFIVFTAILITILGVLLWLFMSDKDEPQPLAMCGECHCIVGDAQNATCPTRVPRTEYSDDIISTLRAQSPINPFTLECDPYDNADCDTLPPQEMTDSGDEAVCGLVYEFNTKQPNEVAASTLFSACPNAPREYLMVTYANEAKAVEDGAVVTHIGACGVCSTTQDLAAYLSTLDMTTAAKECAKRSLLKNNQNVGLTCLTDLGLTDACAAMWLYNGRNTGQKCVLPCAAAEIQDYSNNGPAPNCELNGCLECDEKNSGMIFKKVAGRTRRTSGLLSAIARPCDDLPFIDHVYACPVDEDAIATAKSIFGDRV